MGLFVTEAGAGVVGAAVVGGAEVGGGGTGVVGTTGVKLGSTPAYTVYPGGSTAPFAGAEVAFDGICSAAQYSADPLAPSVHVDGVTHHGVAVDTFSAAST